MKKFLVGLTIAALGLGGVAHAQAPVQFASFSQNAGGNPFTFTNAGGASTFSLLAPLAVNFQFQTPNGLGSAPGQNILATMTLTAQVASPANMSGSLIQQPLKNIVITFSRMGLTDNLLTLVATGSGVGIASGSTAGVIGTESASATDTVTYSSDYLNFGGPFVNKNYSLSLANIDPNLQIDINGYLRSFTASASGTFGSSPPPGNRVPEPAAIALFAVGGLALAARRRKSA